jgi:hypothetical protein
MQTLYRQTRNNFIISNGLFFLLLACFIIIYESHTTLITFGYIVTIGLLFSFTIRLKFNIFFLLTFSVSFILAYYQYKYNLEYFPSSLGFMVNDIGHGADDASYLQGMKLYLLYGGDTQKLYLETGYVIRSFSSLAAIILSPLQLFKEISHLDALVLNCLWHTIGVIVVMNIADSLSNGSRKSVFFAFIAYLFCGFLLLDGLSFMREGVIAMSVGLVIFSIIKKNYIIFFGAIALIGWMRMGAALSILLSLFVAFMATRQEIKFYAYSLYRYIKKNIYISIFVLIILLPVIIQYLLSKEILLDIFFRGSFLNEFTREATSASAVSFLVTEPTYIRTPLLFLYYLFAPFINISFFGSMTPYNVFNAMHAVWSVAMIPLFVNAVIIIKRTKKVVFNQNYEIIKFLIIFFVINIFMISVYSLQLRHKDMLIPVIVIICSYSFAKFGYLGSRLALSIASGFVFISFLRYL